MKLIEHNFKNVPLIFQWNEDNIQAISHAEILIPHDSKNFRLIGSLHLLEKYNGMKIITGFSYSHKIIFSSPNIDKKSGLKEYDQAMKNIIEFQEFHDGLELTEDESEFLALVKTVFFISPIILDSDKKELESQLTSILRRWIEKIAPITHDDDHVLVEKKEVINIEL